MIKRKNKSEKGVSDLRKDIPIVEHEWEVDQIYKKYEIDPDQGLTSDQVKKQREIHGENRLTPPKVIPGR